MLFRSTQPKHSKKSQSIQPTAKTLKFIVDESTGHSAAEFLKEKGHDTVFVGDIEKGISDREILEQAFEENRIIVTNDKYFGELNVRHELKAEGVLILRLNIETPENKKEALDKHSEKLEDNLVIARENQIKTRQLQ